ncbi:hypothetical protein CO540_23950 [Micromonospora sp. WMMA2032]|uniref:hypothetical protein n=1 Tax=Micromonospora sp. WMMA2032 TaxID=2039870 RepID=UPI000C059E18|nr:hypothetical protein [Micromonospora sp. WMMA2032]ATO16523.1 hypothetical protein CO540_23950 [Micromonospora sp. WMMA2032]
MSGYQTVLAATIAALAASIGYWVTQRGQRIDRRAKLYAEALDAVHKYRNLPFLVHWRTRSDPDTRSELNRLTQDRVQNMFYFSGLLRLHCPAVAEAYDALVAKTRSQSGPYRQQAWKVPVADSDTEFDQGHPPYDYDTRSEYDACINAMRADLALLPPLRKDRRARGAIRG